MGPGFGKLTEDTYTVKGKKGIKPGNGGDGGVGGIGGNHGLGLIVTISGGLDIIFLYRSGNLFNTINLKEYR